MNLNAWQRARRVLCIRLDNLGDILMTTPALRALKHAVPDRHLTLLASPSGATAAGYVDEIDDVVAYEAPWMKQPNASADSVSDIAAELRRRDFDAAIIFTVYSQSPLPAAMVCCAAGIPLRLAHCRENPYRLLTDWVRETEPDHGVRHEVQRQLDLVAYAGCHTDHLRLSFSVPAHATAWVHRRLHALGIDTSSRWVLVHPGATAPSRRYPAELWATATERLGREARCPIVFAGSGEEGSLVESIRQSLTVRSHSFCGELDLARLGALIALAPVLLCNNSGPAHIAAAVGTPVVDLYALTNPQHTPWQVSHRVLFHDVPCRFCYRSECPQGHHACLRRVDPGAVAEAAMALLQALPSDEVQPAYTRTIGEMIGTVPARAEVA